MSLRLVPPPPVVGPDAIRCNDPSFNMSNIYQLASYFNRIQG